MTTDEVVSRLTEWAEVDLATCHGTTLRSRQVRSLLRATADYLAQLESRIEEIERQIRHARIDRKGIPKIG